MTNRLDDAMNMAATLAAIYIPQIMMVSFRPIRSDRLGQMIWPKMPVRANTTLSPADSARERPTTLYRYGGNTVFTPIYTLCVSIVVTAVTVIAGVITVRLSKPFARPRKFSIETGRGSPLPSTSRQRVTILSLVEYLGLKTMTGRATNTAQDTECDHPHEQH